MAMRFQSALRLSLAAGLLFVVSKTAAAPQTDPAPALTDAQKQRLQAIEASAGPKADQLSQTIGAMAKAFDRNILSDRPDPAVDAKLTDQITESAAQAVRLRMSIVKDMVKVLTPQQKNALLAELEKPNANPDLAELIGKMLGEQK